MTLTVRRIEPPVLLLVILAVSLGLGAALAPEAALGLASFALVVALVFLAPVTNVVLLLFFTAIVPYSVQNRFGIGGGSGVPGLLLSDLLLVLGMVRAAPVIVRQKLAGRVVVLTCALVAFLAIAAVQLIHGIAAGHDVSEAGAEFRFLLGFGSMLLAVPLLADRDSRRRLMIGLLSLGLLLGAWGFLQWFTGLAFSSSGGDFGVRPGVTYSSAEGQLQGGLYAFPVAVLLSLATLLSGVRSARVKALLVAVLLLNTVSLLLTYERTFWVATVLGALFVIARGDRSSRARVLFWAPMLIVVLFVGLSTLSPGTLPAARERLLSLGQYENDPSVRYRITEARQVAAEIEGRLLTGSGLGATVYWGRPHDRVPPREFVFSHNGYLWLAWKLGIPGAVLLVACIAAALWRIPVSDERLSRAVAIGAQAALAMALIASITFPSFEFLSITAVMGVLLALAVRVPTVQTGGQASSGTRRTSVT